MNIPHTCTSSVDRYPDKIDVRDTPHMYAGIYGGLLRGISIYVFRHGNIVTGTTRGLTMLLSTNRGHLPTISKTSSQQRRVIAAICDEMS